MSINEIEEQLNRRRALSSGGIEDRIYDLEWTIEAILQLLKEMTADD